MKAFVFNAPRGAAVATAAKSDGGSGHHDGRAAGMHPDFMDVGVDIDRGMPGHAAITGTGDPPDMDIHQQRRTIWSPRHGSDAKRRSHALTVDDHRTGVPGRTPIDRVEASDLRECPVVADTQEPRIIRPDVDTVAQRDAASEVALRGQDRAPCTITCAATKLVPIDDREGAPIRDRCDRSYRVTGELMMLELASDGEQAVAPGAEEDDGARRGRSHDAGLTRKADATKPPTGPAPHLAAGPPHQPGGSGLHSAPPSICAFVR